MELLHWMIIWNIMDALPSNLFVEINIMKKRVVLGILASTLIIIVIMIMLAFFMEKQIKNVIKKKISAQVVKNEELLMEVVERIEGKDNYTIHKSISDKEETGRTVICYKDLDDESVFKVFKLFHLIQIDNGIRNQQVVNFLVYPYAGILWNGYYYGFYYSSEDEPIDAFGDFNNCELEFEKEIPLVGYYHYRTERITTNWWYYETTLTVTHNLK